MTDGLVLFFSTQVNDDDTVTTTVGKGKKTTQKFLPTGILEAPKLRSYYHIEYSLLPDNSVPVKADIVMLGLAAKVYMENETKVIKLTSLPETRDCQLDEKLLSCFSMSLNDAHIGCERGRATLLMQRKLSSS